MSVLTEEERRRQSGGPYVERGVLYEHGNQRQLQPNEVASATQYANDYWSQGNVPPPRPTPTSGPGGQTRPPLRSIRPFQGFTPKHAMEGFDYGREQDVAKSAKDAFAYLSNQAPPPPLNDKNGLAVWFSTYIRPGMQELGHNVTDVDGDKFRFNNWQGDFWVDYGRGAGAPGGALAWQADYAQGGPSSQSYNHTQNAIMGVPKAQPSSTNYGAPSAAVLQPLQPQAPAGPDMTAYYQYLEQLLGQESR